MRTQPASAHTLIICNTVGGKVLKTLSSVAPGLIIFTVMPRGANAIGCPFGHPFCIALGSGSEFPIRTV
jgi:hypothetical protein